MNNRIRIAVYLEATPHGGGSFQYADSILHALSTLPKDQFCVRVWSPCLKQWERLLQEKGLSDVVAINYRSFLHKLFGRFGRLLSLPGLRHLRLFQLWQRLHPVGLAIGRWQANVCIFPQQSFLALPKSVITFAPVHDLMHKFFPQFPEVGEPLEFLGRERLFGAICSDCTCIFVDSQVGKEHVLQFYPEAKNRVSVLPFVPPRSLLEAKPVKPEGVPKDYSHRFLFYPAQFWMHKNHVRLLEAVKKLSGELEIHCVFSGATCQNGYSKVMDAISTLGFESRVHVLGYVTDAELAWLYTNAHCMVMPTIFGPTNIPPLEAMHFGCPMALSGNFGMPEQCKDAAIYFDPLNVDDMSNAIRRVWVDDQLRLSMKEAGKRYSYGWQPVDFERRFLTALQATLMNN